MEATFCLSRHLCKVPTFATPHRNRPTIFFVYVNDLMSFHSRPSLPSRPLQAAWTVQKKAHHHKTWAVSSLLTPPEGGNGGGNGRERERRTRTLLKATVVLACVLGSSMGLAGMVVRRADAGLVNFLFPPETDNGSQGIIPETLKELLNPQLRTNKAELKEAKSIFSNILKQRLDALIDFEELQKVTRKLKSDKEGQDQIIEVLEQRYKQYVDSGKYPEETSRVGYILVEMYICQGKFDEGVIKILKDCYNKRGSENEGRPALYWAAAYPLILGDKRKVRENWKDFVNKVKVFSSLPTTK